MKVVVDKDTCIGCALCCMTCESVFRLDENGKSEAYGEETEANANEVQMAIDGCPVAAISRRD